MNLDNLKSDLDILALLYKMVPKCFMQTLHCLNETKFYEHLFLVLFEHYIYDCQDL